MRKSPVRLAVVGVTLVLLVGFPAASAMAHSPSPPPQERTSLDAWGNGLTVAYYYPYYPQCLGVPAVTTWSGCARVYGPRAGALLRDSSGIPLQGKPVTFTSTLGGSCSTTTDSVGRATWTCIDPPDQTAAGFSVVFAGDLTHLPATASAPGVEVAAQP